MRIAKAKLKTMTVAEVWRTIGRAFEQYAQTGRRTELTELGLCNALGLIEGLLMAATGCSYFSFVRRDTVVNKARGLQYRYAPDETDFYWWNLGREDAACRAVFCELMALIAEEEGI
jgi:hypothetical protein